MATNPFEDLDEDLSQDTDKDELLGALVDDDSEDASDSTNDNSADTEDEEAEDTDKGDEPGPEKNKGTDKDSPDPDKDKKVKSQPAKTAPQKPAAGDTKTSPLNTLLTFLKDTGVVNVDTELSGEASIDQFKEVFNKHNEQISKDAVDKYFDGVDEQKRKDIEFIKQGGDISKLQSIRAVNWNLYAPEKVAASAEASKIVMQKFLSAKGLEPEAIANRIAKLEKSDLLGEEAADALKALQKEQTEKEAIEYQKASETESANKAKLSKLKDLTLNTIRKEKIEGFDVPPTYRKQLEDYIYSVDAEGKNKQQQKEAKMTDEQKVSRYVFLQLLEMVNFDFTQMSNIFKSQDTESLSHALEKLAQSSAKIQTAAGKGKPAKQTDDDDVLDLIASSY
jgi:hypothetical protein